MRLDLASSGPAKNATISANRVLVRQAAAVHKGRFGVDLFKLPLGALRDDDDPRVVAKAAPGKGVSLDGGNGRMKFYNSSFVVGRGSMHRRGP